MQSSFNCMNRTRPRMSDPLDRIQCRPAEFAIKSWPSNRDEVCFFQVDVARCLGNHVTLASRETSTSFEFSGRLDQPPLKVMITPSCPNLGIFYTPMENVCQFVCNNLPYLALKLGTE